MEYLLLVTYTSILRFAIIEYLLVFNYSSNKNNKVSNEMMNSHKIHLLATFLNKYIYVLSILIL